MAGEAPRAGPGEITLECYKIYPDALRIIGGRGRRPWMDATDRRYAYRCTPMSMANESGWEVLCPIDITATWDGRKTLDAISIECPSGAARAGRVVSSHFGHGILTFQLGWLFRTSPGWGIWARGAPNRYKEGITPLEGLVETDWLAFSFTMNWRFVRPGTVSFKIGEPICFLTLCPHAALDKVVPTEANLMDNEALYNAHALWKERRADFNQRLAAGTPEAVKEGWEKTYLNGPSGGEQYHSIKRRLSPPVPDRD